MNISKSLVHHNYTKHLKISLMLSLLLFFISYNFLLIWISAYYNSPDVTNRKIQEDVVSFQRYVMDNDISSNDILSIEGWNNKQAHVHLFVHSKEMLTYSKGESFPIDFHDGECTVTILLSYDAVIKKNVVLITIIFSLIVFMLTQHYFFIERLKIIDTLKSKLHTLASPPFEGISDTYESEDSEDIEEMLSQIKTTLQDHVKREKRQSQITSDILASLSHDFKTPITVIIGYLQIIRDQQSANRGIIDNSIERAQYLHQLVDDTLYYFHSSSLSSRNRSMENVNCSEMLSHYCAYQEALLEECFIFENHLTMDSTEVEINELLMNRVFDNLISNIRKYADPSTKIHQTNFIENDCFVFEQRNGKKICTDNHPSTLLGLKTCQQIMGLHNGHFDSYAEGNQFVIRLCFPLTIIKKETR